MTKEKLKLNEDKTEAFIFSKSSEVLPVLPVSVLVGDTDLKSLFLKFNNWKTLMPPALGNDTLLLFSDRLQPLSCFMKGPKFINSFKDVFCKVNREV